MAASFVIEGSFAMLHRLSTGGLIAQVQKIVAAWANKVLRDRSSHRARITARTAPGLLRDGSDHSGARS
jgi:hypothetical protein